MLRNVEPLMQNLVFHDFAALDFAPAPARRLLRKVAKNVGRCSKKQPPRRPETYFSGPLFWGNFLHWVS